MNIAIARHIAVVAFEEGRLSLSSVAKLLTALGEASKDPEIMRQILLRVLDVTAEELDTMTLLAYERERDGVEDFSSALKRSRVAQLRSVYDTDQLEEIGTPAPDEVIRHRRYIVGRELGRGGVGRVVAAWDRYLHRSVALKIAQPNARKAAESITLEARTTGGLEHPNIIPVYDFHQTQRGDLFFAMKYVRRHSLYEVIQGLRRRKPEILGEYSLVRLLGVFQQICMALYYAHMKGVIHRDVKPDNVMLGEYGEVLVVDWGLAYVYSDEASSLVQRRAERSDKTPRLVGTPEYMPPEQAQGDTTKWGPGIDIYALGATLYEILTLRPPHGGTSTAEVLDHVVRGRVKAPIERNPDVPEELNDIVMRALASEPKDRYPSAKALRDAIEGYLDGRRRQSEQRKRAQQLITRAEQEIEQMHEVDRRLTAKRDALARLHATVDPDAPLEDRKRVWRIEDEVQELTLTHMDYFEQIEAILQQAFSICPEDCGVRSVLAQLYLAQSQQIFTHREDVLPRYYRRLVSRIDPGGAGAQLEAKGRLMVRGAFGQGTLARLTTQDRQLVPTQPALRFDSGAVVSLDPGAYLVELPMPGQATIRTTCRVKAGETNIVLLGDVQRSPDPSFVYVPGGPTFCGGDPLAHHALQGHTEYVGPFFASTFSVTFGEYASFLSALYQQDPDLALRHVPRTSGGGMLCDLNPGVGYEPGVRILAAVGHGRYRPGSGAEWMVPVFGISLADAQAYIAWRSSAQRVRYRFLTEWEWERLVRGGDGRAYPWGDTFDPSFCLTQSTHRGGTWPEPAGVYPIDSSPFGVRDLAGGVQTWTQTHDERGWVVKGGAWSLDPVFSRAASRRTLPADARLPEIGLRLAIDLI